MDFFSRNKKYFVAAVIIICAVMIGISAAYRKQPTIIGDALGYAVAPAQKALTGISKWFGDKIDMVKNISTLADENAVLKDEIEYLQIENARLKQIELENERLTRLYQTETKFPDYPKTGAAIIAKDPGNWYDNFEIDKGRKDGVDRNMVVISSGGLVGRVIESGYNYSKVKAIIDDESAVNAQTLRTNDLGVVKGDMKLKLSGLCRMDRIDIQAEIMIGDEVVTSNLGEIYPPGITIGYIKEINYNADGLTKYAIVEPDIDFKHLETVFVITERFERVRIDDLEEDDISEDPEGESE